MPLKDLRKKIPSSVPKRVKRAAPKGIRNAAVWDSLPWKSVEAEHATLGEFEESVFMGLEEIDGSAYSLKKGIQGITPIATMNTAIEEASTKRIKKKKKTETTKTRKANVDESIIPSTIDDESSLMSKSVKSNDGGKHVTMNGILDAVDVGAFAAKNSDRADEDEGVEKEVDACEVEPVIDYTYLQALSNWGINEHSAVNSSSSNGEGVEGVVMCDVLHKALCLLNFSLPTPIQSAAIPLSIGDGTEHMLHTGNTTFLPSSEKSSIGKKRTKALMTERRDRGSIYTSDVPGSFSSSSSSSSSSSLVDIVGAAETGSGKTLAFVIPIVHSLLMEWSFWRNTRSPHSLIVAPTRELAMQISSVIREISNAVTTICQQQPQQDKKTHQSKKTSASSTTVAAATNSTGSTTAAVERGAEESLKKMQYHVYIEVVNVVGGMSQQKQQRQLAGKGKPVHILVATPGRLCDLLEAAGEEVVATFDNRGGGEKGRGEEEDAARRHCLSDLSALRFLVVDEADRIMEEGHFPELHRVFSRIREHERIAETGADVVTTLRNRTIDSSGNGGGGPSEKHQHQRRQDEDDEEEAERMDRARAPFPQQRPPSSSSSAVKRSQQAAHDEVRDDEEDDTAAAADDDDDDDDDDDGLDRDGDVMDLSAPIVTTSRGPASGESEGDPGMDTDMDMDALVDLDMGEVEVPMMPSEAEVAAAQAEVAAVGAESYYAGVDTSQYGKRVKVVRSSTSAASKPKAAKKKKKEEEEEEEEREEDKEEIEAESRQWLQQRQGLLRRPGSRQTLLYSATAISSPEALALSRAFFASAVFSGGSKKRSTGSKQKLLKKSLKLNGTLKGITQDNALPDHLKQLLSMVAIQKTIHVVDVVAGAAKLKDADANAAISSTTTSTANANANAQTQALPQGLTQEELHVPSDEKDLYVYYYLTKNPGRSLVFVNSIKAARRLDGLLRALDLNCRTLHAQLQQRQRLRALDQFAAMPIGVLVATDVAARGLDISQIQSVIHYDVARSPQVYIHRSGRTARANQSGTTVSLVSPEDAYHHHSICSFLRLPKSSMPVLHVDLHTLPLLRQRIAVAKKLFVESFVASQQHKDAHWLKQNSLEMGIELDDYMKQELDLQHGDKSNNNNVAEKEAKDLSKDKTTLPTPAAAAVTDKKKKKKKKSISQAPDDETVEDDDRDDYVDGSEKHKKSQQQPQQQQQPHMTKKNLAVLRAQLRELLHTPLPSERTYQLESSRQARVQSRGGGKGGKKASGKKRGAAVLNSAGGVIGGVENAWKRRSSFFVYAK